jgi:argininosuccinate synthase
MLSEKITRESVGVCVSGGLSSLAVAVSLAESGVRTRAFVADLGQAPEDDVRTLARSLESAGVETTVVDLRDRMAEAALDIVRYQASYEGGYWNTTGASRMVLVSGLADPMRRAGCTALAHGCVGGGNDQRRFARYAAAIAPDLQVISPWTEPELLELFPDRSAMAAYLAERGVTADSRCTAEYSVEGNMAGFAHEGTALEQLQTPDSAARPTLTVPPQHAPDQAEAVTVRIESGHPAQVGHATGNARELLERANAVAGRHGVGLRSVVEDRINGTKCRGVYEAPGLDLLGFCVSRVYQVTMDKESRKLMSYLSGLIGEGVYEARYLDPAIRAARAAADVLIESASATAEVEAEVYKGGISFRGLSAEGEQGRPPRQTRFSGGGHYWQVVA